VRVLIIAKDFPCAVRPDAGIFVLRQVQALATLGFEPLVVRVVPRAPAWTDKWRGYRSIPDRDVVEGVAVRTIRAFVPPRMVGFEYLPLQVDAPLRQIANEFRPDLVHGHFLIPSGQLAVRCGVPSVITAHGSDAYDWAWRRRGLRRAAVEGIQRATEVVAVSEFVGERVRALFDRTVRVVHNGADERLFAPADRAGARRELGIPVDRFVVSFVGGAVRTKGAFDLVVAAAQLRDLSPLLLIAGPNESREDLARRAEEGGVDVRWCGTVAHAQLARILAAADVSCLPSYREGLPASVCEAMLAARPVVATPVGGIPEIVTDGVNGYLVPPGSTDDLARRLRQLAENPALAVLMGERAHRYAQQHLTWSANARAYAALYRSAVATALC
jgi:teichuronic acid biosynthesis glycosyltransferase TuaC